MNVMEMLDAAISTEDKDVILDYAMSGKKCLKFKEEYKYMTLESEISHYYMRHFFNSTFMLAFAAAAVGNYDEATSIFDAACRTWFYIESDLTLELILDWGILHWKVQDVDAFVIWSADIFERNFHDQFARSLYPVCLLMECSTSVAQQIRAKLIQHTEAPDADAYAIVLACNSGDVRTLKRLFERAPDVRIRNARGALILSGSLTSFPTVHYVSVLLDSGRIDQEGLDEFLRLKVHHIAQGNYIHIRVCDDDSKVYTLLIEAGAVQVF